ncbi:MAG: hypothetical protein QM586_09170 [Xenophilus sp.]
MPRRQEGTQGDEVTPHRARAWNAMGRPPARARPMSAWGDGILILHQGAWRCLVRFYDLICGLGVVGCAFAAAAGWLVSGWGLRLTAHEPPSSGMAPGRAGWLLGRALQVGGTFLTAVAMVALARTMVR